MVHPAGAGAGAVQIDLTGCRRWGREAGRKYGTEQTRMQGWIGAGVGEGAVVHPAGAGTGAVQTEWTDQGGRRGYIRCRR